MEAIPSGLISFAAADGLYCSNASDIIGKISLFTLQYLQKGLYPIDGHIYLF